MNNKLEWIPKGWGGEKIITNNEKYCGKILYIMKGYRCSLHYHQIKDETFFIYSGKIKVSYSDDIERMRKKEGMLQMIVLEAGDTFHIPPNRVHQMIALEDTELFEFSTQDFPEDSIRIIKGD